AIGLILGGMLEKRLGQSMVMLDEQWWLIATRPLSLFFLVLTVLALAGPFLLKKLKALKS
ncbi:MAG: C4-dicarboxylate ABC transporter permease, partial [bacterium]